MTVTDSGTQTAVQNLQVTVTNVNEAPSVTSSATPSVAGEPDGGDRRAVDRPRRRHRRRRPHLLITGGADAGAVHRSMPTPACSPSTARPTSRAPADADANNVYDVQVTVTDTGHPDRRAGPAGHGHRRQRGAGHHQLGDAERGGEPDGGDRRAVDRSRRRHRGRAASPTRSPAAPTRRCSRSMPTTGVLTFNSAPDFEAPADADANNVYDVQVTVTDSDHRPTDVQNLQVTVTNAQRSHRRSPARPPPSVAENQTAVIDVQSTDPDGDTEGAGLTYSITGGADPALFSIDADDRRADLQQRARLRGPDRRRRQQRLRRAGDGHRLGHARPTCRTCR